MNETAVLDPTLRNALGLVADYITGTRAHPDWCDHCRHGDHLPCDLWGRQGCRCPHHDEETG